MSRNYIVELATPADDADIRHLLATSPIPGSITMTYEREPEYFLGCGTMGHLYQVGVGRLSSDGTLVGLGCRASRPMFVNGQVEEVGYLGQLRIAPQHQGRWLLSDTFRFLHDLHADGRTDGYITTIIEGNTIAEGVLVRRALRQFPAYREVVRLCTPGVVIMRSRLLRRLLRPAMVPSCTIGRGSVGNLTAIVAFLQQQGSSRQFFPSYQVEDFGNSSLTHGFRIEDFVVAWRGGHIVGVMGLWDQSHYKQNVVQSYHGSLRWLRPVYNAGARMVGAQPLPAPGGHLRTAYASFICIENDQASIFDMLLWHTCELAAERGCGFLLPGLATTDPLLPTARRYPHIPYYSRLYTVCWQNEQEPTLHDRLDERIPYVEIASL